MDSQKISQLVENRELYPITDIGGELNFIFKSSLFWRPTYLAQSAWLEHIPFAFWLVDTLRPRNIVELGTHYGSSYFSFCQAVSKLDLETCCFAVDTWGEMNMRGCMAKKFTGKYQNIINSTIQVFLLSFAVHLTKR